MANMKHLLMLEHLLGVNSKLLVHRSHLHHHHHLRLTNLVSLPIRRWFASNVHLHKTIRKSNPTDMALKHYDSFYSKVYDRDWPSIRLGLLSPNKYCAIVNNFNDSDEAQIRLRQEGAYSFRYIYEKNLRRLLRHLQRKAFFQNKIASDNSVRDDDGNQQILPRMPDESCVTSESEFEEIGAFFTDSEDDSNIFGDDTFVNQARMDLNFDDFVPVTNLRYREENPDNDKDYFLFYDMDTDVTVNYVDQNTLNMSSNLELFTFPRNDYSSFPAPKMNRSNLFDYYLADGASALPVLVLDIQPGDNVGDFCAAPGGKSLMMFMASSDCRFFLNEKSLSRFNRLKNVFKTFVPQSAQKNVVFSNCDANSLKCWNTFDKILVDVPCTNDRHSLYEDDNNIFNPKRMSERINLPNQQLRILYQALMSVKVGGSVVYSSCSLSPIQNDGVVHMTLSKLAHQNEERNFSVVNLREAVRPLRGIFKFDHRFKYGTQIVSNICSNFGPMYFCKLIRTS